MVIWKHTLKITDIQKIVTRIGATWLSAGNQNGNLCIWSLNPDESEPAERTIQIIGTGNKIYTKDRSFIGTVIINPFVWHVFELFEQDVP